MKKGRVNTEKITSSFFSLRQINLLYTYCFCTLYLIEVYVVEIKQLHFIMG